MLGVSKDARGALVSQQGESLNPLCCSRHVAGVVAVARVARVAQARRHSRSIPKCGSVTQLPKMSLGGLAQSFWDGKLKQH